MLKQENITPVLVIIYCCIIFAVSSIPGTDLPELPATDYIMHGIEYAGLGFLLAWWRKSRGESVKKLIMFSLATASLYGITDEVHQYFVPGRFMSLTDWIADTIGAMAGIAIFLVLHGVSEKNLTRK